MVDFGDELRVATRLSPLLEPRSIAVIGASARRPDAAGNLVVDNLIRAGYRGELHLVHPSGAVIQGLASVSSIRALPSVDAAFLTVPAASVLESLIELEQAGSESVIVPSSGIDAATLRRIRAFAANSRMVVHGPNCMGIVNVTTGTPLWIGEGGLADTPSGSIALVSQSGSAAIFVARSAWPAGFSKIISTGNEVAVSTSDYVSWLSDDPATSVIGLVVESIQDGPRFAAAVHRAHTAGKAVVALKVGRSSAGARATTAHTGALLSSSRAYDAFFESLGVPVVHDYDELASTLQFLGSGEARKRTGGVAVLTISGGQAAMAADLASDIGVDLTPFSSDTQRALVDIMPDVAPQNPFDGGGSVLAPAGSYARVLRVLANAPEVASVMVVVDAQSTLSESEIRFEDPYVRAAREVHDEGSRNEILIASSSSLDIHPRTLSLVDGSGLTVVRGIRNALIALTARAAPVALRVAPSRPDGLPSLDEVERWRRRLTGGVSAADGRDLLALYGIPFVASRVAVDAESAIECAEALGYPVVVKVDSPDVPHRSDVGGVVLDVADAENVRAAIDAITASVQDHVPGAMIFGFEVQRQLAAGSVEAFVGFTADERIGASIACGLGGTLVELYDDAATAHAPVGIDVARRQIERTRLGALLAGHRNLVPPTDTAPLVDVIVRLSWMAADFAGILAEADLNPVLVSPGSGAVDVVDALLVGSRAASVSVP